MPDAESFARRLKNGKGWSLTYQQGSFQGLVEVWALEGRYILTWEEYPLGEVLNEYLYTVDERHEFSTTDEALAFLTGKGIEIERFTP